MTEPTWQLETERLWLRRITLEDAGLTSRSLRIGTGGLQVVLRRAPVLAVLPLSGRGVHGRLGDVGREVT